MSDPISSTIETLGIKGNGGSARAVGVALGAIVLILATIPACQSGGVSNDLQCPISLFAGISLPDNISGAVSSIFVAKPCSYFFLPTDGGSASEGPVEPLFVVTPGGAPLAGATTCAVEVKLVGGEQLRAAVTFRPLLGSCSNLSTTETPNVVLVLEASDGGA
jgi:hypothetical protein